MSFLCCQDMCVIYVIFSDLNMILKMAILAILAILTVIILLINARVEENEYSTIFLTSDMINETVLI